MKRKQFVCKALLLFFVLACFSGCSTKSVTEDAQVNEKYHTLSDSDKIYGVVGQTQESLQEQTVAVSVQNQKLIRKMTVEAETADLDMLLAALDDKITSLGGYVENQYVRNGNNSAIRNYRYAELTIRIPADRLEEFFNHVRGQSNVVYYQESADDVTLSYVATQSRVKALETEQVRLLELLAKAENMTDLLQIEQRLTEVRTELEKVTSQLRLYDNMVDYGTLRLTVTEVREFTVVEEETVWQRISSGFGDNLKKLGMFLTDTFVLLIVGLPYCIPIGVTIIIVVLAVKLVKGKHVKKKTEKEPPKDT